MKAHYEKIIVACCFLFIFVNIGLVSASFSVYQPYLVALPGVGHTGGSLILGTRTLVSMVSMMFVDRYYRLLDVRIGVALACGFTAIGFFIYSFAEALALFLVGAFFAGLGYGLGTMAAMTYVANRWYANGRGTVIGTASIGSSVATMLIPLAAVYVIETHSLSVAFALEALLAFSIGVLMLLLLRNRPGDVGLKPYDTQAAPRAKKKASASSLRKRVLLEAPAYEYHILLFAVICVGIFCNGAMTYYSVLATSHGMTTVFGASMVSMMGAFLAFSKIVTGKLFDRVSTPAASAAVFGVVTVGLLISCLISTGNMPLLIAGAAAMGFGLSLGTVGVSIWSLELSSPAMRERAIRQFQVRYAVGGFIVNALPGFVADLTGSYIVSYIGMACAAVAACVIIVRYYRKFTRRDV